ncbi:MAG: hypothetical protein KA313_03940 [Pseudarcicella sp.]|nr:hypothetical protein [Pseudarcicella sp.]MBP6410227.1 hypothetical protein [Pseudarcicella sp.]
MTKIIIKTKIIFIFLALITSCEKKKEVEPITIDDKEFKFITLMVSDEKTKQISIISPKDGKIQTFDAKYAKSAVYATESGRFGSIIHRDFNFVENFDTGYESHGDHVDIKGTPKWAALIGEGNKPTHFGSYGGEIVTFNDGDGTLSIAQETDMHQAGFKMKDIPTKNIAHHGAMARFQNGNYAITEKDGSIAGTLPERVKIINKSGDVIATSSIQTKGIHGNKSDGKIALFGSASGVLAVDESGSQRLIKYPESFETAWLGTIFYGKSAGKFLGYSGSLGVYEIDLKADKYIPIFESKDILQCKLDKSGSKVIVLLLNGDLKVFDLKTLNLVKNGNIGLITTKEEAQKPTLEATDRFAYIVLPKTGEVQQFDLKTMSTIQKIKVSDTPYRIAILGSELNKKGDE